MRLKTVLIAASALVLVVVVAAILAIRSMDFNKYKGLIADRVKAATGRDLMIAGTLGLEIGFSPAVVVEDVSFANAPWGSRPEMVKVHRFEVQVALLPLIFRDIRVKRLVLVQPDILLETNTKGVGNWSFGGAAAGLPASGPKPGEAQAGLPPLAVERVRIEKGILAYRDGRTKHTTRLTLDRLDLQAKGLSGALTIDLAAAYDGKAFTLTGTVGPLGELQVPTQPYPIALTLKASGVTAELNGTIAKPMEASGLDVKVAAKGQELAEVAKLAGKTVPALGPFAMAARVTGSPAVLSVSGIDASVGKAEQVQVKATGAVKDALHAKGINLAMTVESKDLKAAAKAFGAELPSAPPLNLAVRVRDAQGAYAFDDLKASIGKSRLAGSGVTSIGGPRPRVKAQFASTLLDLAELLPQTEAARKDAGSKKVPEAAKDGRLFPADPLPLGAFKTADADVELKADRVVLPDKLSIEALALHLLLANGRLEVQPLSGRVGGGTLGGRVVLDASAGKTAVLAAKIDARAVDLGQALREIGHPDLVTGTKADLSLDLKGGGGSVRELMAELNGDLLLVLGEGRIHSSFVDWLGADLLTQITEKVNPLGKKDPYAEVKCGVIRFAVKDGVASSDKGIAFETSKMTLVSSGTANLKSEAIDFSLLPETRQGVGIGAGELVKLLRIRGTLAEPKVGVDELSVAKRAASIGAAVATGGLSFLAETLVNKSAADPHPCETAQRKAAPSTKTAPAPSAQQAPKPEGGIGQFFKGLFGK